MKHIIEGQSKLHIIEDTHVCKMQKKTLSYISPTMCAVMSKSFVSTGLLFWKIPDSEKLL